MRWLALIVLCCGCGKGGGGSGPADASADAPDAVAVDAPDTIAVDAPDVAKTWPDTGDAAENPCPNGVMEIDFPCAAPQVCTSLTTYATYKTLTCADLGYNPQCCNGLSCSSPGSATCPSGTLCAGTACHLPECTTDAACPGSYCMHPPGQCTAPGVCVDSGLCGTQEAPKDKTAWTTCSGESVVGLCALWAAHGSVAQQGVACDPDKVLFSQDNPLGFTQWEACISWGTPPNLPNITGMKCGNPDATSRCAAEELACVLDLAGAGTISDAAWQQICDFAAIPAVTRVVGRGGAQCSGAPGPVHACGDACSDPCGCAACGAGMPEACSATDTSAFQLCQAGCWQSAPCGTGLSCSTVAGAAQCTGSCADLQAAWNARLPGWQPCGDYLDCQLSPLVCGLGGSSCKVAVNKSVSTATLRHWLDPWTAQCGKAMCKTTWGGAACSGTAESWADCTNGFCQAAP